MRARQKAEGKAITHISLKSQTVNAASSMLVMNSGAENGIETIKPIINKRGTQYCSFSRIKWMF